MERKRLTVRINDDLYKKVKILTVMKGITIQDYLIGLMENDLKKENEPCEKKK